MVSGLRIVIGRAVTWSVTHQARRVRLLGVTWQRPDVGGRSPCPPRGRGRGASRKVAKPRRAVPGPRGRDVDVPARGGASFIAKVVLVHMGHCHLSELKFLALLLEIFYEEIDV